VCKDSAGAQTSKSFKDSKEKLRRSSAHLRAGETQVEELAGKITKVKAFEHLEFFQVLAKRLHKLEWRNIGRQISR